MAKDNNSDTDAASAPSSDSSVKQYKPPSSESSKAYDFRIEPELISHLLEDGRASMADLADVSGQYRQKSWRAVKALEDDVIWGYTAVVDEQKLGWFNFMILAKLGELHKVDVPRLKKFIREINAQRNLRVTSIHSTADHLHHWVMEVTTRNPMALNKALKHLQSEFPDLLAEEPLTIQLISSLRKGGKDNPDKDAIASLIDELID